MTARDLGIHKRIHPSVVRQQVRQQNVSLGFTLIELLIVITLLTLMMSVVMGSLRLGARSWDTAQTRLEQANQRFLVQNFLRMTLSQAHAVMQFQAQPTDSKEVAFIGQKNQLQWVAPLPSHQGGGLHWMTLRLVPDRQGSRWVMRHRLFHPDVMALDSSIEKEEVLLEDIESLQMSYFGLAQVTDSIPQWLSEWQQRDTLPDMIRIRVKSSQFEWPELVIALHLAKTVAEQRGGGGVDFGPSPFR